MGCIAAEYTQAMRALLLALVVGALVLPIASQAGPGQRPTDDGLPCDQTSGKVMPVCPASTAKPVVAMKKIAFPTRHRVRPSHVAG